MATDEAKRVYHRLKLRARRRWRKQKKQVEGITEQADTSLDKHLFRRTGRLYGVRRFVAGWTALLLFSGIGALWQVRGLDSFYLKLAHTGGGVYREGMVGSFTTANPLFAVGGTDVAVAKLVFSGLFKISPEGTIEPDLGASYTVSADGLKYTVVLQQNVKWHDGDMFNADDVVFTYESIKDPQVKSPLLSGWSDVTVKKIDNHTVSFTLPNALASFPYSLTNGIVPHHILDKLSSTDLRSSSFNTIQPIGTGPFKYTNVEVIGSDLDDRQEKVTLETNTEYFRVRARVDGIVIRAYRDEELLLKDFENKEINAVAGIHTVSDRILSDETITSFSTPLSSQVMIFLNNSTTILSDKKVRQALVTGTDTAALRQGLDYQLIESNSPFLKSHFTYDSKKVQLGFNKTKSEALLESAGWKKGDDGKRRNEKGQELMLRLVSQSLTEYATVVKDLQKQWGALGVKVDAILQPEEDIQSGSIVRHDYDVLLYGISLGPDPDVFAYWHSSQADPRLKTRLNLSEYDNNKADQALEAGRTRQDEALRKIKYEPFLDEWREDAPAIALYQPRFLLLVRGNIENYQTGEFTSPADRFYSVTEWQVRREKTVK